MIHRGDFLRADGRNPIKNNDERYTVVILTLAVTLGVGWRWQDTNVGRCKFGYRILGCVSFNVAVNATSIPTRQQGFTWRLALPFPSIGRINSLPASRNI